jgi:hypothetical protein
VVHFSRADPGDFWRALKRWGAETRGNVPPGPPSCTQPRAPRICTQRDRRPLNAARPALTLKAESPVRVRLAHRRAHEKGAARRVRGPGLEQEGSLIRLDEMKESDGAARQAFGLVERRLQQFVKLVDVGGLAQPPANPENIRGPLTVGPLVPRTAQRVGFATPGRRDAGPGPSRASRSRTAVRASPSWRSMLQAVGSMNDLETETADGESRPLAGSADYRHSGAIGCGIPVSPTRPRGLL